MRLLFEEAIKTCFNPPDDRLEKLKNWVENAETARNSKDLTEKHSNKLNQYDKAEELITFYTFAPLILSLNRVGLTNRILSLAGVSPFEENVEEVTLEKQFSPSKQYMKLLRKQCENHPIKYIREQAPQHRENQPLEGKTHADAFIRTDKLLIFFEIKFTSDISYDTTFNPIRNQLARLVDVGLEENKKTGKEVLVILSAPKRFFEERSRLYYYKIKEYEDPDHILHDLPWRNISEIKDNLLKVAWIPLESLIGELYRDFKHEDLESAKVFFKERNLITQ
jgi:hypothetical protein